MFNLTAPVFSEVFDPRANGLNFIRLALALGVIFWHSVPLTGHSVEFHPVRQLVSEVWVDGFFAISGFLIVSSWMRDPHVGRYLRARMLRILPAFWVCLIVTAFVIVPVATGVIGADNIAYVVRNSALWMFQFDIEGTPANVPYAGVWNGSIWTLAWEFACYLLVLLLGASGALRIRATLWSAFALCVVGSAVVGLGISNNWFLATGSRFGIMFLAGALVWQYRDRIPVTALTISVSAAATIVSLFLSDYRLVAALPLAFLLLTAGAVLKSPRLRLRNDISYGVYIYAFPIQQVLALAGAWQLGVLPFALLAVVATIPMATLSWFAVERPALRLKNMSARKSLLASRSKPREAQE